MAHDLRKILIAALAGACVSLGSAAADDGAPRQSRPQQLAQACRTLCIEEFNACQRACDGAPTRIDCISRCQTRLNLCNSTCR
jgi:hypothetical protein